MFKKILGLFCLVLPLFIAGCSNKGVKDNMHISGSCGLSVNAGSYKDFMIRFANEDRVNFYFDSKMLAKEDRMVLSKMADWFNKHNKAMITIEGHCDSRGTDSYNLALGKERAESVKTYFIAKGISSKRIKVISFGKNNQPVPNAIDETSHALNRTGIVKISK